MKQRDWWPDRQSLLAEAALLAGVVVLELVIELHTWEMDWTPPLLDLRVPVLVLVLLLRRRFPLLMFALAVVDTAVQQDVSAVLPVAAYALTSAYVRWSIRLPALAVATAVTVATLAQHWGVHTATVIACSFVLWPGTLGAYARARSKLVAVLVERAERAETAQEELAHKAVAEERVRIAGEMHDVVGHRVSLMVLHAGAVEMSATNPTKVTQLADQMQAAGRQALQELRQLVGLLRTDDVTEPAPLTPQPKVADLADLVEQSRRAGMDVTLQPLGQVRALTEMVERTAYRVVQEALTNAGRHAPGGPVSVTLDYRTTELAVRVVNQRGTQAPNPVPGRGHGLLGLRERAHAVGGRLRADPSLDGGFAVEAVLPT